MKRSKHCLTAMAWNTRSKEDSMNPWHLVWIVPLSGAVGAFLMALIAGGTQYDKS